MNWNAGSPTASNDRWSVPVVLASVRVRIPPAANGAIQASRIGPTAAFPCW
jgi:hypothetical protein